MVEIDKPAAKLFVETHHYDHSFPAARRCFGLFREKVGLVGVAVFAVPTRDEVVSVIPGEMSGKGVLSRLVLLDAVEANGESWFVARCFELLRRDGWAGVVSFADPNPRTKSDGSEVKPGHLGIVYRALNGRYLGRSKPDVLSLLPDGTVLHRRAISKIRHREEGWRHCVEKLVAHGAAGPARGDDLGVWLARWLPSITRRVRHGGNLKYVWPLDRRAARAMPTGLPYPSWPDLVG